MSVLKGGLLAFCEWCNASFFGHAIRDSVWAFPFVEIFHLLALAILGGSMLVLNMRLVGIGFRTDSVSILARELRPCIRLLNCQIAQRPTIQPAIAPKTTPDAMIGT